MLRIIFNNFKVSKFGLSQFNVKNRHQFLFPFKLLSTSAYDGQSFKLTSTYHPLKIKKPVTVEEQIQFEMKMADHTGDVKTSIYSNHSNH